MDFVKKNFWSLLTFVIIIFGSLSPTSPKFDNSSILFQNDKIIHFFMYLIFMSVITYDNRKRITKKGLLFIALIVVVFSGILEILQFAIIESRSGSYLDFFANIIGTCFSLIPTFFYEPIKKRVF